MKTKRLSKKLVLTRETISNLNVIEMADAIGGTGQSYTTGCPKYCFNISGPSCPQCDEI